MADSQRLVSDESGSSARTFRQVVAYRFGSFRFCMSGRILEREGIRVAVTPKVADTLLALIQRAGTVVSKDELIPTVWPDVVVAESGLTRNIAMLRQALGEGDRGQRFIETVPRRGYRFVGDIDIEHAAQATLAEPASALPVPQAMATRFGLLPALRRSWVLVLASMVIIAATSVLALVAWRPAAHVRMAHHADPDARIGRHLLQKITPSETARARDYFRRSMAAHPYSAEGYAGAASALVQLSTLGMLDASRAIEEAAPLAERALELQPNHAMALAARGAVLLLEGNDLQQAETCYQQALDTDPQSLNIYFGYSMVKLANGDLTGARALVDRALEIDPASPRLGAQLGKILYLQRDFGRAAEELRQVLDREPGYALAHYYLALSLGFLGHWDEAYANLDATRLNPDVLTTDRTWLDAMRGDPAPATRLLAERQQLVRDGKLDASANLLLAATLRNAEVATEALNATLRGPAAERMMLRLEPRLDSLRDTLLRSAPSSSNEVAVASFSGR